MECNLDRCDPNSNYRNSGRRIQTGWLPNPNIVSPILNTVNMPNIKLYIH